MPSTLSEIAELQQYLIGVMARAAHHASSVHEIALALAGAIVWKKDDKPIRVLTRDGEMKNVLWVRIGGARYAFSYNHGAGTIEMRRENTHGDVMHSFCNATSLSQLRSIFDGL